MSLFNLKLWTHIWSTNINFRPPPLTLGKNQKRDYLSRASQCARGATKNDNFCSLMAKSACHDIGTSWTDLYQTYRFGRHMRGDDWLIDLTFVWWSAKGHCCGNQLNFGAVCSHLHEWPLLFALAFDNGFAHHEAAFKRLNGNNAATFYKSGELMSNNLWVYAVKTCNFWRDSSAIW